MSQISHKEIISLILSGYSITEIADMLEVSRTTIYNRRKDFLDYAEKEGIKMAAEHFDVEKNFEELFNLARELKNYDLRVDDAKKGSEIAVLLNSIKTGDPVYFIKEVIQKAEETGITGDEITNYSMELRELENKEGKTYKQLISEINCIGEEKRKSEKDLSMLIEQVADVRENLDEILRESETTNIQLKSFVSIRDNLSELGLKFEDMELLDKLLVNIKEHDFNLDQIIDFYGAMRVSREDFERYNLENNRLQEHNKALLRENYTQEERLEQNLSMVSAVKRLTEIKIKPEDILDIANTVTGIAMVNETTNEEALDRFMSDVKTQYTERSGYVFELDELKRLLQTLQDKNSLLKEKIDILEEVLEERKEAVESLQRIEALGINDNELFEWGKLVKDLDYDLSIFREGIEKLGGMPEYIQNKTEQITLLEAKEKELQKNVHSLEQKIEVLHVSLDVARETVEANVDTINNTIKTFEDYFLSPETGFKIRNTQMVNEISQNLTELLEQTKTEWGSDLETLDTNIQKIVEETNRILENAYKGGRIVGRFHALEPIHKILREEQVSLTEGTIGIITMLTYIKIWLARNYSDEEAKTFDPLIERLVGDLGDIYKR